MSVGNRAIVQMKKVLQKLKQKFNPDNYPNPALNYHYDCLQAIALKEDLPVVQDKTVRALASTEFTLTKDRLRCTTRSSGGRAT
jgi:hypothetical protein